MERLMKELKWLKAECPVCGRIYEYTEAYKPSTCSSYDCVHKWIHDPQFREERRYGGEIKAPLQ